MGTTIGRNCKLHDDHTHLHSWRDSNSSAVLHRKQSVGHNCTRAQHRPVSPRMGKGPLFLSLLGSLSRSMSSEWSRKTGPKVDNSPRNDDFTHFFCETNAHRWQREFLYILSPNEVSGEQNSGIDVGTELPSVSGVSWFLANHFRTC